MAILAYRYADVDSRPHLRYVISEADYKIAEIKDEESDSVHRCFEFTLDGKNYQFEYNEEVLHESDIYFCSEHNILE